MPNTDFASIDPTLLADVQGGCGKKRHRCCCSSTIINNTIQQAPAPAPMAAPPPSGGTAVDVNVGYTQ